MPTRHRTLRALRVPATLALLATLICAATANRPVRAAGPGTGSDTASLVSGTHRLEVVTDGGDRFILDLEPGVRFRSVAALDDGWITAGVRGGRSLLLVRGRSVTARPERMPTPTPGGSLVADPVPLVRDGRLEGLAWLAGAGARSLGARYAEWLGDGWGPTEAVSAPGPGSQLALVGATLGTDEILLVWSAYDGSDDEVVWAHRSDGAWSEPARIADDNLVPDITPALTVLDERPVVAWSRYDGRGYRLVLSHRNRGSWSEPEWYGPTGSLFPHFDASENGALLLFRDVRSAVWTVLRLDEALRPTARASVESSGNVEPAVIESDAERLEVIPDPRQPLVEIPWQQP